MYGSTAPFPMTPPKLTASCSPRGYTWNIFDQEIAHLVSGLVGCQGEDIRIIQSLLLLSQEDRYKWCGYTYCMMMMEGLHRYLGIWIIKYSKVQLKSGLSAGELAMWMGAVVGLGLVCAVKQEMQLEAGECASARAELVWIWAVVRCLFMSHWCILGSFSFVTQLLSVAPFAGLEFPVCVCVCALVLSHVFLFCDPMDSSLPGSSVHGVFQAKILGCIFPTQGSSRSLLRLLHWQGDSLPLCPLGSPSNSQQASNPLVHSHHGNLDFSVLSGFFPFEGDYRLHLPLLFLHSFTSRRPLLRWPGSRCTCRVERIQNLVLVWRLMVPHVGGGSEEMCYSQWARVRGQDRVWGRSEIVWRAGRCCWPWLWWWVGFELE